MNLDDIKQILDLVREHELNEFELERDGLKVRIRKGAAGVSVAPAVPPAVPAGNPQPAAPAPAAGSPPPQAESNDDEANLVFIKSPIVGTFYRAPDPSAPPFVNIGDRVRKGQVLCIIEAMKLMNEIESDCDGEVAAIYVENGKPVQFGDRLFAVKVSQAG
ncbi:MAG: acetyl-CoA carboxylase biotin carboxyl carrier protein [Acidobacteriota bacterium]|jgi:acetyl-CoA carboxylase biotin carboxyl carrier protein|nr:MAG: acetyl-CoA carboxylase biotin carboxyl carrier protein [Acidobacteriota bacterium]